MLLVNFIVTKSKSVPNQSYDIFVPKLTKNMTPTYKKTIPNPTMVRFGILLRTWVFKVVKSIFFQVPLSVRCLALYELQNKLFHHELYPTSLHTLSTSLSNDTIFKFCISYINWLLNSVAL